MSIFFYFIGLNEKDGIAGRDWPETKEVLTRTISFNPDEDELLIMSRMIVCLRRMQHLANTASGMMIFIALLWAMSWFGDWSEIMPMFGLISLGYLAYVFTTVRRWQNADWK